jgi:hypothetical protein
MMLPPFILLADGLKPSLVIAQFLPSDQPNPLLGVLPRPAWFSLLGREL